VLHRLNVFWIKIKSFSLSLIAGILILSNSVLLCVAATWFQ